MERGKDSKKETLKGDSAGGALCTLTSVRKSNTGHGDPWYMEGESSLSWTQSCFQQPCSAACPEEHVLPARHAGRIEPTASNHLHTCVPPPCPSCDANFHIWWQLQALGQVVTASRGCATQFCACIPGTSSLCWIPQLQDTWLPLMFPHLLFSTNEYRLQMKLKQNSHKWMHMASLMLS